MIGYGNKRGFCGKTGAEAVLGWGKKVVASHVGVQLLLSNFLYNLGEGGYDRDGTKVG